MQDNILFLFWSVQVQMGTLDVDHTTEVNGKQDQYWDPDPDQNFAAASYLDLCCI